MGQKVLINVEAEDIRVAIMEEGILTDLFVENRHQQTIVGNIYKGVVMDVIPGIQAAFVDVGLDRNAFLHIQDIPPLEGDIPFKPRRGRRGASENGNGRRQMIADYVKPGQEVLVQAIKDGISEKGPRISMYLSLPGRYLVYLPDQADEESGGVSRKIDDRGERKRLKNLLSTLDIPEEDSVILRTAALEADDESILADAEFLQKTSQEIQKKIEKQKAPSLLHQDYDILYRLARDVFTDRIDEIYIDDTEQHANMRKMLRQFIPKLKNKVLLYANTRNLFEVFDVERQIYKALRHRVWLRSGGHLVIDECEALTAIDVNTGKFIGKEDQEMTVLRTNLESARVIARQLRLRDIGGIIIIDFIDMKRREHREEVLRELKRCLRYDRARTTCSEFTELGIVEMTRKRVRHSLRKTLLRDSPMCGGSGMILSLDSTWRVIRNAMLSIVEENPDHDIKATIHGDVLEHIRERHMDALDEIQDEHGIKIELEQGTDWHPERYLLSASPSGVKHPNKGSIISIEGKRFSGAELDEEPKEKPRRRRARPVAPKPAAPAKESPVKEVVPVAAAEEAEDEEDSAAEDGQGKRRRRGRRGGRRRRRGGEEVEVSSPSADRPRPVPARAEVEAVDEPDDDLDPEIAAILAAESLSGELAAKGAAKEPARLAVKSPERSERAAEDATEDRPRRRRGKRGGRRQRERREGSRSQEEESTRPESAPAEPKTAPQPAKSRSGGFTPVEEFLSGDGKDPSKAPAAKKPAKKAAVKKTTKKAAQKTTVKKTATKKAAAKKTAKKKTTKKAAKKKAAEE